MIHMRGNMKKNFLIGFLLVLCLLQLGYTYSRSPNNPALMHMRLKEFMAGQIAAGLASRGWVGSTITPQEFAAEDLKYTNALMEALDKEEK